MSRSPDSTIMPADIVAGTELNVDIQFARLMYEVYHITRSKR